MQSFFDLAIFFLCIWHPGWFAEVEFRNAAVNIATLCLYLLMPLGLKDGFALAQSGLTREVLISLGAALGLDVLVYLVLRRFLNGLDAAAIAVAD